MTTDCAHEWVTKTFTSPEKYKRVSVTSCTICGMKSPEEELPNAGIDVNTGKPARTSADRFWGWNTIYGRAGEHAEPYMTRAWFGRLRLHIFHRGDNDPDPHDHPWGFWTFPLVPYLEEVLTEIRCGTCGGSMGECGQCSDSPKFSRRIQVVPAWWPTYRPATHTHRVICAAKRERHPGWLGSRYFDSRGRTYKKAFGEKKIVTLVWRGKPERKWGFLKHRDGKWCWVHWKEYVFGGGKNAPCE